MNIKDAYIHGSDAVVKSINVNADKLIYKLADKEETLKTITLPTATTSANGLMSADLVKKIDNIQLTTDKKLPVLLMKQEAADQQILIPYMQNDIAYPIARGGYIKVAVDGVEKTGVTDIICNGMPDYMDQNVFGNLTTSSVVTVEIDAVTPLYNSQYAFIIFSAYWLVPKSITLEAKLLDTDNWTTVKTITDNTSPCFACPLGTYDSIGYRYLKYTITGCPSSQLRITEIGVASYNSQGLNNIVLSKGGGEMYGSITPFKNSTYDLGANGKAWKDVFASRYVIKRADGAVGFIGVNNNNIAVFSKNDDDTKVFVFDEANRSFRRGHNAPNMILGTSTYPWKNVYADMLTFTNAIVKGYVTFNNKSSAESSGVIWNNLRTAENNDWANRILIFRGANNNDYWCLGEKGNTSGLQYIYFGKEGYDGENFRFYNNGQFKIPAAEGTAPLVVSSKTMVSNLNAEMVGGFKYQYSSSTQDVPYKKLMTIRLKNSHLNSPISFDINQRSAKTRSTVCARFNGALGSYTIMLFKYMGDSLCANLRIYNAGNSVNENGAVVAQTFEIWTTKKGEYYDSLTISNIHCNHQDVWNRQISIECHSTYAETLPTYTTFVDCTLGDFDVIASSSKMLMGSSNAPLNVGNYFTPVYFNGGVPTNCSISRQGNRWSALSWIDTSGYTHLGKILTFNTTAANTSADVIVTARDANDSNGAGLTIGGTTIASGKFAQYSGVVCSNTADLSSYWGKLWSIEWNTKQDDLDVTIYIHSSYMSKSGIVHVRGRFESTKNEDGTYTEGDHVIYIRQIVGNLTPSSFRLYYKCDVNASTGAVTKGQLELWCNVVSRWGVYNAVLLSATSRTSKEYTKFYGTFYNNTFTTVQTPTLTDYVEMTNVVINQTAAKALAADKAYNADNATKATNSDYIFIHQDKGTNKDLPIPWLSNDDATNKYVHVYKSYGDLSYNPVKKRITTGLFKGCIESVAAPTADNYCLQYFSGNATIGDSAGNAKEGSYGDYNLWSYPKGGTYIDTNSNLANIQTLRLKFTDKYFHDLFMSPNQKTLWHRSVHNGSAKPWCKILESNDTYIKDGVISIGGVTMTPVTAHQDLSNYVRLDTAQTISGKKTFTGDIQFNATNVGDVTSKIVWKGGNDTAYLYYDYLESDKGKLKFEISDNTDDSIEFWWKTSGSDGAVRRHYIDYNNLVITGTATATTFKGNLDWGYITNKPTSFTPSAHTHASNQITALTGYSKSTAASDLAATDSLNTALGKLEYKSDYAYDWIIGVTTTDTDEYINKWSEIVDFIDSVKEGTDITDEFVTRKTSLTITGAKSFTSEVKIYGGDYGVRLFGSGEYGYLLLGLLKGDEKVHKGKITGFQSANLTSLDIHSDSSIFSGNVTASKFIKSGGTSALFLKADGSVDSNTYATTGSLGNYLPLSGGTMTGPIKMKGELYNDNYAIDMNNSNIVGLNAILTKDVANGGSEGYQFKRSNNDNYDSIWCKDGVFYFSPDGNYNSYPTNYTVLHSGNYSSYTPILNSSSTHATNTSVIYAPTTGGTSGLILKSNGSSAPTWVSGSSISVGNSDKLDNLHASDFVRTVYGILAISGTKYVKLGTLPVSSNGTYDSFVIKGSIGGWSSPSKSYINISVSRRESVGFLGSVQYKNTDTWDIGVNSGGEVFLIFKNQYAAWSLSLHTNLGTIDYVENATPADTTWTLLSESSNILWYSNTGVVDSAIIASKVSNALTFSAGKFATKTYDGSSAVTVNIPTHTSHLTNNSGYLTQTDLKTYTKYYYFYTNKLSSTNSWIKLMLFNHSGTYGEQPLTFNYSLRRSADKNTHVGFITIPTGPRPSGVYVTGDKTYTDKFRLYTISETATENKNSEGVVESTTYEGTYALYFDAGSYCSGIYWDVHANSVTSLELLTSSEEAIPGEALPAGDNYITSTMGSFGGKATAADKATTADKVAKALTIFGSSYDGSVARTITYVDLVKTVLAGDGDVIDNTDILTSHINGFETTDRVNVLYKRKAKYLYNYVKTKNDALGYLRGYTRSEVGNAPNFDDPGFNGFFEVRTSTETSNETGVKPFNARGPMLTVKCENVMFQLAGNGTLLKYRAKQASKVTLANVAWNDILTSSSYTEYTVKKDGTGATGTWGINISGSAASTTTATRSNYLETLKQDGSGWYGNQYKLYALWGSPTILDLKCDGYFTRVNLAKTLDPTEIRSSQTFSLLNTTWLDTGYTFASLDTGTYAIQITSTNLVASGIMSVYKNLSDTMGDEIPLHVYGTAGWRPYLRTSSNKLQISSDDAPKKNADGTIVGTSRTVTIKIARIL